MKKHYNIYYLFLEDKEKRPMPEAQNKRIRENIESFYKKVKPP